MIQRCSITLNLATLPEPILLERAPARVCNILQLYFAPPQIFGDSIVDSLELLETIEKLQYLPKLI